MNTRFGTLESVLSSDVKAARASMLKKAQELDSKTPTKPVQLLRVGDRFDLRTETDVTVADPGDEVVFQNNAASRYIERHRASLERTRDLAKQLKTGFEKIGRAMADADSEN